MDRPQRSNRRPESLGFHIYAAHASSHERIQGLHIGFFDVTVLVHYLGEHGSNWLLIQNFFPTIVETLGFNTTITLVLTCPPYLVAGCLSVLYAWSSGRFNERTWHITISKAVACFGFVLACVTMNTGARYFAMCVFTVGTYGVNSILLGWVGSTCGQTKEKKAAALAIVNTSASVSFIWTPYLWPSWDEPRYIIPMASSAAFCVACAAGAWVMKAMLVRANRRIRQSDSEATLFFAH